MISVLIPTYNYNPAELLSQLTEEIARTKMDVEILIWDDASINSHRKALENTLSNYASISHRLLDKNLGRARIRNAMAEAAQGDFLLFLDADGVPAEGDFLSAYQKVVNQHKVVVGGRVYEDNPPHIDYLLHWKYGSQREVRDAGTRNLKPSFAFQSNNFLIKKDVFMQYRFDDNFVGYGHEDTLFGKKIGQFNTIFHINNPTVHKGLEKRKVFLQKSLEATAQLAKFIQSNQLEHQDTKLGKTYLYMQKNRLLNVFDKWSEMSTKSWENHLLTNPSPSLRKLDLYRLRHFMQTMDKNA